MNKDIKLLNFTSLDKEHLKMILSWRNDPFVKQWMFTSNEIKLEDHFKFVESLKTNTTKKYFLVEQNGNYIGVIDFCNITQESTTMGVYKNPLVYGVGAILLETIIDYAFKKLGVTAIYSEVFEENIKALTLYKSFGFEQYSNKFINHKNVICLKLIK